MRRIALAVNALMVVGGVSLGVFLVLTMHPMKTRVVEAVPRFTGETTQKQFWDAFPKDSLSVVDGSVMGLPAGFVCKTYVKLNWASAACVRLALPE